MLVYFAKTELFGEQQKALHRQAESVSPGYAAPEASAQHQLSSVSAAQPWARGLAPLRPGKAGHKDAAGERGGGETVSRCPHSIPRSGAGWLKALTRAGASSRLRAAWAQELVWLGHHFFIGTRM